jgi:hypothetical protein
MASCETNRAKAHEGTSITTYDGPLDAGLFDDLEQMDHDAVFLEDELVIVGRLDVTGDLYLDGVQAECVEAGAGGCAGGCLSVVG